MTIHNQTSLVVTRFSNRKRKGKQETHIDQQDLWQSMPQNCATGVVFSIEGLDDCVWLCSSVKG